jgi:molecular chaperone GrpE
LGSDWSDEPAPDTGQDSPSWDKQFRDRRSQIIERFTRWLDETLDYEAPPEGVDAELLGLLEDTPLEEPPSACTEYDVWSSLTALVQEVKLQGRTFRDLTEATEPLKSLAGREAPLEAAIAALEASRKDLEQTMQAAAQDAAWREIIELLIDVRNRLCRNGDSLHAAMEQLRSQRPTRRTHRWLGRKGRALEQAIEPLHQLELGNALVLERLDESLARVGIHEIPAENLPFDPATMKAVDVMMRDDLPEGTVCAVHQRGYLWRGEVYRLAEVAVTRHGGVNREVEQT